MYQSIPPSVFSTIILPSIKTPLLQVIWIRHFEKLQASYKAILTEFKYENLHHPKFEDEMEGYIIDIKMYLIDIYALDLRRL